MKPRHLVLIAAALATGLAALLAPDDKADVVQATKAAPPAAGPVAPAALRTDGRIDGKANAAGTADVVRPRAEDESPVQPLWAQAMWLRPPPRSTSAAASAPSSASAPPAEPAASATPPEPAPTPPPPQAPPLPFRLLGSMIEDGRRAVFVQFNDQNLVVRGGEIVAGNYKVESVSELALTFLYLPTNEQQVLNLGAPR